MFLFDEMGWVVWMPRNVDTSFCKVNDLDGALRAQVATVAWETACLVPCAQLLHRQRQSLHHPVAQRLIDRHHPGGHCAPNHRIHRIPRQDDPCWGSKQVLKDSTNC